MLNTYSKIAQNNNEMQIPEAILEKWATLRSHGDGVKIAEMSGKITPMDVSRAISAGECSDTVFEAIGNFYKGKEEKVNEYL